MKLLKERIIKDGEVLPGNILKVSSFLNHQLDIDLLDEAALEFKRRFEGEGVTRILTIEASGIAVACAVARAMRQNGKSLPIVFAKKNKTRNISEGVFSTPVHSYTTGATYEITISKNYLSASDTVLIIDDFLANGCALEGLVTICRSAGAKTAGAGIVIEKAFQEGGRRLRSAGLRIESLAIIKDMSKDGGIVFQE